MVSARAAIRSRAGSREATLTSPGTTRPAATANASRIQPAIGSIQPSSTQPKATAPAAAIGGTATPANASSRVPTSAVMRASRSPPRADAEVQPDVIICGMSRPSERAMQTIESLLDILPDVPIIAYGWQESLEEVRRAMLVGARDFILFMPVEPARLAESIRIVIETQAKRKGRQSGETPERAPRGFVVSVFAAKGRRWQDHSRYERRCRTRRQT